MQAKRTKPLEGTPSTRTGKPARWRPQRRPLGEREPLFGRRLAVVYDVTGPRIRLGVLWFAVAVASIRLGRFVGAVVFGAVAAVAALQTLRAWRYKRRGGHNIVAGCTAFALPVAAAIGTGFLGLVLLGCVGAAVVAALCEGRNRDSVFIAAAHTIRCSLPVGMAAASIVLAIRLDISAALLLVLLVSAYEAGDFLIGSGADNSWEGPAAGIAAVLALSLCTAVLSVPPFHGPHTWPFAALVAVGCPLGQIMGSLILPDAGAKAPALRRLDSLFLLGPAWVWLVGLYIGRLGA